MTAYYENRALQFKSVQSLDRLGRRGAWGHAEQFSRDPLPVFSAGGPCGQFWHGQGWPHFDVVHQAFPPMLTTASATVQGVLGGDFEKGVLACDLPELCKFLSLDRERLLV